MNAYGELIARDAVRIERLLPGPIGRVWDYFIDADKRSLWIGGGEIEPVVGGRVEISVDNASLADKDDLPPPKYAGDHGKGSILGTVTACEPPHLLAYQWQHGDDEPSKVRIELEERGDKVLLTLTHERLPSRDWLLSVSAGWHTHLDILAARLAGEAPSSFWRTMTGLETVYEKRIPSW